MGDITKIGWCATRHNGTLIPGSTFNSWIGCTKISDGCKLCYAESQNKFYGWTSGWGKGQPRKRTSDANWNKPIAWAKQALIKGYRHRIFCASLADVFDGEVCQSWRDDLWKLIDATGHHTEWLLLTKRPDNLELMLPKVWIDNPPEYVRIGVTAEMQEYADLRIPILLEVWKGKNFISVEPMLGPVDLNEWLFSCPQCGERYSTSRHTYNPLWRYNGLLWEHHHGPNVGHIESDPNTVIDWVIYGGESQSGCREMNLSWARFGLQQCKLAGVPAYMKQLGGHPNARKDPAQWPDYLQVQQYPEDFSNEA